MRDKGRPNVYQSSSAGAASSEQALDDLLAALADERCRAVVRHFRASSDDVASVDALADTLADGEGKRESRDRLAIRLHHAALPRLAEAGVVEYDARNGTVRYRGHSLITDDLVESTE